VILPSTHAPDIVLWPGLNSPRLGLGLYNGAPLIAFVVEVVYGLLCWRLYRGGSGLLAFVTLGNLANLSFLSAAIPGPEQYLAGRPMLVVTAVFLQMVVSFTIVAILTRARSSDRSHPSGGR
jgi:hypothetical protein